MYDKIKILDLISQKQVKNFELESLIYGSIEVREDKYIYIHARENGLLVTKYVGEYTEVLYNLLLSNNLRAKELKKEIKNIEKELKRLDYIDEELTRKVSDNIDLAKRNLVNTIYKQAILEGVVTTLSDTENIIEGGIVNNMTPNDILKVINLKHAWEFILNKNIILSKTDFNTLSMINRLVLEGFYYNAGMLRTLPVDIAQYYGYMLRAAQKLLYLYGFPEINLQDEQLLDSATMNTIIICMGVMYGVAGANTALKTIAKALGKGVEKKLINTALTKGTIYPIVRSVAKWFNVRMTKEVFAGFFKKTIPVVGGVIGGGITYATFKPCCEKLKNTLKETRLSNPNIDDSNLEEV